MKRLTKTFIHGEVHTLRPEIAEYYIKLSKYEDIEELCELVTAKPIFEKYLDTGEIHEEDYTEHFALFNFEENRIELHSNWSGDFSNYLELKEYGKHWALTKEELL